MAEYFLLLTSWPRHDTVGNMDKYQQLKELVEYVTKTVIDLPYPYRNPDGDNDYHHVVRLIMSDVKTAMEKIDNGI